MFVEDGGAGATCCIAVGCTTFDAGRFIRCTLDPACIPSGCLQVGHVRLKASATARNSSVVPNVPTPTSARPKRESAEAVQRSQS